MTSTRTFAVYSTGLKKLAPAFPQVSQARMLVSFAESSHRHPHPQLVEETVSLCLRTIHGAELPDCFICLDARGFYENLATLEAAADWNHCGQHVANGQRLAEHPYGHSFVEELRDKLLEAKRRTTSRKNKIGVILYCRSGRDRSVGCALLTHAILKNIQGWSGTFEHLCQKTWRRSGVACVRRRCLPCFADLDRTSEQCLPAGFRWDPL